MLSLGTEDFFAFWTASNSVGLPERSPPPVRAATSMFLISLAKSLPRLASIPAFLCLVVAHLEWPLIAPCPSRLRQLCRSARPGDGGRSRRTARAPGGPRSVRGESSWPPDFPGGPRRSYRRPVRRRPARGPRPPHRPPPPRGPG